MPGHYLRQKDLATLADIDGKALAKLESGKALPSFKELLNLAAALDVPPHVLYAAQWRDARERANQKRRSLGWGKAYPDLPEPQALD